MCVKIASSLSFFFFLWIIFWDVCVVCVIHFLPPQKDINYPILWSTTDDRLVAGFFWCLSRLVNAETICICVQKNCSICLEDYHNIIYKLKSSNSSRKYDLDVLDCQAKREKNRSNRRQLLLHDLNKKTWPHFTPLFFSLSLSLLLCCCFT